MAFDSLVRHRKASGQTLEEVARTINDIAIGDPSFTEVTAEQLAAVEADPLHGLSMVANTYVHYMYGNIVLHTKGGKFKTREPMKRQSSFERHYARELGMVDNKIEELRKATNGDVQLYMIGFMYLDEKNTKRHVYLPMTTSSPEWAAFHGLVMSALEREREQVVEKFERRRRLTSPFPKIASTDL